MSDEPPDRVTEAMDNTTALFIGTGQLPSPEEYHDLFTEIYKCACTEDVFFAIDDNIITLTKGE